MGIITPGLDESGISKGFADGFVVEYNGTTEVTITPGVFEANGRTYTRSTNTSHTITGLGAALQFQYIYIDDSASIAPVPVFTNAEAAPVFDPVKRGWYNGDDRMLGVVVRTTSAPLAVDYFDNEVISGNVIRSLYSRETFRDSFSNVILTLGDPTGVWQATTIESSTVLPVNATGVKIFTSNSDLAADVFLYTASQEYAAGHTDPTQCMEQQNRGFDDILNVVNIPLGASRNIKWAGENTNDNNFNILAGGMTYVR